MGKARMDVWTQEAQVDKFLMRRLTAMASKGDWWAGSINILTGMVIQLLARGTMDYGEIARYVGCPEGCVRLIASHYAKTVKRAGEEYTCLQRQNK